MEEINKQSRVEPVVSSKAQESHIFEVEKHKTGNGFTYDLFFTTEEEAKKAVINFWTLRDESGTTRRNLESGILEPFKHEIIRADRTSPREAHDNELRRHPGKKYVVQINGNTSALSPKGETVLRRLGYFE